jgi:hypothetical protein
VEAVFEFNAFEGESTPIISINDAGTRGALAQWPHVTIRDEARALVQFVVPAGDSSAGTTVLFDEDDVVVNFVSPAADPTADYQLVRAYLDSGSIEPICGLPQFGVFTLLRRPSFSGIAISTDDGQNGSSAMLSGDTNGTVAQVVSADHGFMDLSPAGDLFVEGGGDVITIGAWPEPSMATDVPLSEIVPTGERSAPWYFANFTDDSTVLAWPVSSPGPVVTIDVANGTVLDRYGAIGGGTPVVPIGIAARNGQALIIDYDTAYLTQPGFLSR